MKTYDVGKGEQVYAEFLELVPDPNDDRIVTVGNLFTNPLAAFSYYLEAPDQHMIVVLPDMRARQIKHNDEKLSKEAIISESKKFRSQIRIPVSAYPVSR